MLTRERAEQLLSVDFKIGILTWKFNYQRPDLIGKRAGWEADHGYWRLAVDGRIYYACQIIWLLFYGYIPVKTIDHADCNEANDSIGNLRLATKAQNMANSKMNSRNTSGFRGVSYCYTTNKWRASIRIAGTEKNLGRYALPEIAHQAWAQAAIAARGIEFVRLD